MSTLKVNAIRQTAASSDAVTLAADGTCTAKITNRSNRNLLINGAMNVHQRGGTTTGQGYLLDRWHIYSSPTGKHTVSQDTETPVGFKYSMKWTSASAYTPTSGNYFYTGQRIEGHNWDQMEYGTANAKTCTISFWARSSITGTWSGILKNNAQDRTYPWEYTISSANTWEKKTVTIPGCTDGTWLSGNNAGAWLYFCIGSSTSGTTYLGSANSWQNSNLIGTTGSNSLVNTNGATLYVTGVQLEVGNVATDFEHRSYGDELARCQRYYWENTQDYYPVQWDSAHRVLQIDHPVWMRATPTETLTAGFGTFVFQNESNKRISYYTASAYNDGDEDNLTKVVFSAEL